MARPRVQPSLDTLALHPRERWFLKEAARMEGWLSWGATGQSGTE